VGSECQIHSTSHSCSQTSPVVNVPAERHPVPMIKPVRSKAMKQSPPLRGAMTCDVAFQAAATHYLDQLTSWQRGTAAGDAGALHAMRVALTRLRTSIRFFSPMVAGPEQIRVVAELKWLNAHLGMVRDLDVALERLMKINKTRAAVRDRSWKRERAACQKLLTAALRSPRYRQLIDDVTAWTLQGDWLAKGGAKATTRRDEPTAIYSARKLARWRTKLLKKSRKLRDVGAKKRHDVRLANKRVAYAIETTSSLIPESEIITQQAMLAALRKAQKSLGQLNDDERRRSLASTLGEDATGAPDLLLTPKQKRHLLRRAASAYEELDEIKPLKMS
jgi:CHAD domain-containing protein